MTLQPLCGNFRLLILTSPPWLFLIKLTPEPLLNAKNLDPQYILPKGFGFVGVWQDYSTPTPAGCHHCILKPTKWLPAGAPPSCAWFGKGNWTRALKANACGIISWFKYLNTAFPCCEAAMDILVSPPSSPPAPQLQEWVLILWTSQHLAFFWHCD